MRKVVHVHLIFEKRDYYFGSICAIFDYLSDDELGIKKSYLQALKLKTGDLKLTKRAIIRVSSIYSCKREKQVENDKKTN